MHDPVPPFGYTGRMRKSCAFALGVTLLHAPLQCTHEPDPNLRSEDTAGDALWALAQDFRARHDEGAARATLQYLAEHYPSSRYAPAARSELGMTDGGA
jgi:hypothetical protein